MKFDSFTGTADSFPSLNIGAARTVNWTQEPTSEKSAFALVRTPGLSLFVTLPKSPCRGIFPGDGALYAVGADHLYQILVDGTIIDRSTSGFSGASGIGTAGGTIGNDGNPVQFAVNGNQLLVVSAGNAHCRACLSIPPRRRSCPARPVLSAPGMLDFRLPLRAGWDGRCKP